MTSLKDRRAMSESRVLDITLLLKSMGRDSVAGGSFGDVYQYQHTDGRICAVKTLRPFMVAETDPKVLIREISREAQHWQALTHPNILPMLGVCFRDEKGFPSLVSPWMGKGNARKYLDNFHNRETIDFMKFVSKVAYGVAYLHSTNIVHGDIRGPNILINDDGEPCIADLGFAKVVNKKSLTSGSPNWPAINAWSPPEYLGAAEPRPTTSADVFSFGATVIELWTGNNPFPEFPTAMAMVAHIAGGKPLPGPPAEGQREFQQHRDRIHEVFSLCCDADPTGRIAMTSMAHMLVSGRSAQNEFIKQEEDEDTAMRALYPSGHSKWDDDYRSAVSSDSSTYVPPSEAAEHRLPNYMDHARAPATPTQRRLATPAPPIPRSSAIKHEEADSDILTDAFNQQRISPRDESPPHQSTNGTGGSAQRQHIGSSPLLFSSPNPMSPAIADGYLPASLSRKNGDSPGSTKSRSGSPNQGRPVDLRAFPAPPSPNRAEGANTSRMTVLNNHCARNGKELEVKTKSVGQSHVPSWSAQCIIDGVEYGKAANMHKKIEAREEAARQTLDMLQHHDTLAPARERYLPMFNDHLRANDMTYVFADRKFDKGGSDHQPIWVARFLINGEEFARGTDGVKKDAEERAAVEAARKWRSQHALAA